MIFFFNNYTCIKVKYNIFHNVYCIAIRNIVHVEHNETSHNDTFDLHSDLNFTCSSCGAVYGFVQNLLIRLNVTTPCCLGLANTNSSSCDVTNEGSDPETSNRTDPAKGI